MAVRKHILCITGLLIVTVLFFMQMGCAPSAPSGGYRSDSPFTQAIESTPTGTHSVASKPTATGPAKEGRFTISLAVYAQGNREQMAQHVRSVAMRELQSDDVWLDRQGDNLAVNYGYFMKERQARKALEKVRQIYSRLQTGPYQFPYMTDIAQPDPPAPAEWDIRNHVCAYSLEVGVYYNEPESNYFNRKKDAVEAVRVCREKNIPAYFYHGPYRSHVLISCMRGQPALSVITILRNEYPHHFENGRQINEIKYDQDGKEVKIPRPSFVVDLQQLLPRSR